MDPVEASDRGRALIKELEELVCVLVKEHNYVEPCLTEDFSSKLGLRTPEGIEITRCILKRLKSYGKIRNIPENPDGWETV